MRATYERVSANRRDAVDGVDESGSRIVRRERIRHVPVVPVQQVAQVVHAADDVRLRIERVAYPVLRAGCRHQLHETHRAGPADGGRVAVRLRVDHRVNEVGLHAVQVRGGVDQSAQLPGRQRMRTAGQKASLTAPKERAEGKCERGDAEPHVPGIRVAQRVRLPTVL